MTVFNFDSVYDKVGTRQVGKPEIAWHGTVPDPEKGRAVDKAA